MDKSITRPTSPSVRWCARRSARTKIGIVRTLDGRAGGCAGAHVRWAAGANIITFHPRPAARDRTLVLIRDHGCKAGLVFNPPRR